MGKAKKRAVPKVAFGIAALLYATVMLWLLFGQRWGTQIYQQQMADSVNLQPLRTIRMYIGLLESSSPYLVRHAVVNLAGNVVMFIPLGFFLPCIFHRLRAFWKTAILAILLILCIEAVQYVTLLGTCDVDDLILNVVGIVTGYLFWKLMRK